MTLVDLDGLLACLEFEDLGEGRWTAPHLQMDYRRIFGGQLLAQAVVLADASAPDKAVRSLSCVFPREGSLDEPLEYRLEGVHDGRAVATRRVTGGQGDRGGPGQLDPPQTQNRDQVPHVQAVGRWIEAGVQRDWALGEPGLQPFPIGYLMGVSPKIQIV